MPVMGILDIVEDEILTAITCADHPRFYGYVPGAGSFVAAMGDALASGFNCYAGQVLVGSGSAAVEATVLGWLRTLLGFPASAAGIFLSGGSMANLTALQAARFARLGDGHDDRLVVYGTREQHFSLNKALRILGFRPDRYRNVETDGAHAMRVEALERMIASDRALGLAPFMVATSAGSTSTGAIDPLADIRRLCDREELWMHVDGAYGAAAWLDPGSRVRLEGMERADSLVIDPHKWWFQPYEIGCVLVRDGALLRRAFSMDGEYLSEARDAGAALSDPLAGDINFYEFGPQLTRSFRALKLWMFIKAQGVDAIAAMIGRGVAMGEALQRLIETSPHWQVATPASLGVVTFRARSERFRAPEVTKRAVERLLASGYAYITTTEVDGERLYRLCPINPASVLADIEASLEMLARGLE